MAKEETGKRNQHSHKCLMLIMAEKNASHWSKEKFNELLVGTEIETDFGKCEIVEISKCEGDAVVNNRKAKLIFFYEWDIEMKWKGALVNSETEIKGIVQVPNLSEEHEMKDIDVNILLDSSGPEADILKDMMRSTGIDIIKNKLSTYLTSLKEEFSKGLILPTKDSNNTEAVQTDKLNKRNDALVSSAVSLLKKPSIIGKIETTELKNKESFKCTAEEFYRAMTVKELVMAFTQGNCVFEPEEGGKFVLFDGNVQGHFVKLAIDIIQVDLDGEINDGSGNKISYNFWIDKFQFEPNKTIIQKWRFKTWPEGHFSDVVINIEQKMDCTEVHISQYGIPKTELENTSEGWKRFYWDSMKRTFGFGALLF